jgi:hypothetical protein
VTQVPLKLCPQQLGLTETPTFDQTTKTVTNMPDKENQATQQPAKTVPDDDEPDEW